MTGGTKRTISLSSQSTDNPKETKGAAISSLLWDMDQTNSKDAPQLIQEVLTRGQTVVLSVVKLGVVSSKEKWGT